MKCQGDCWYPKNMNFIAAYETFWMKLLRSTHSGINVNSAIKPESCISNRQLTVVILILSEKYFGIIFQSFYRYFVLIMKWKIANICPAHVNKKYNENDKWRRGWHQIALAVILLQPHNTKLSYHLFSALGLKARPIKLQCPHHR